MENNSSFYFEVLPVHPQPAPLESFTSYLRRLAQANNIPSLYTLASFFFPEQAQRVIRNLSDYPPLSFGKLSVLAVCPESRLLETTFYHLVKKFGRSTHPQPAMRFLGESISQKLRYCPKCIEQYSYYSLAWRFQFLTGCPIHCCQLLSQCTHCGKSIPLFSNSMSIGICPSCNGDLGSCPIELISNEELYDISVRFQELKFLLSSHTCEDSRNSLDSVSKRFIYERSARNKTQRDVAAQVQLHLRRVQKIESLNSNSGNISFQDCLDYSNFLKLNLQELFEDAVTQEASEIGKQKRPKLRKKGTLLGDVKEAVKQLYESGQPVTFNAVSKKVNTSYSNIKRTLSGDSILTQIFEENYQFRKKLRESRENDLVDKVKVAIEQLKCNEQRLTLLAISNLIQVPRSALRRYLKVALILEETVDPKSSQKKSFQLREKDLMDKVETVKQSFKSRNEQLTLSDFCTAMGMGYGDLYNYPRVKLIMQDITKANNRYNFDHKQISGARLLEEISSIIQELKQSGKMVTPAAISKRIGLPVQELMIYSEVRNILTQVIESYPKEIALRQQQREDELTKAVQRAVTILELNGESVTQVSISKLVSLSITQLKKYPHVKIIIAEAIIRNKILRQRHPPRG